MSRLILQRFNGMILLLLGLLGLSVQTSLFSIWPISYLKPDVALWLVVWFGLRRRFIEGGILSLVLAYFQELHSSAPAGVLLVRYTLIFLLSQVAQRWLVLPRFETYATLTGLASVLGQWIQLGTLGLLGVYSDSAGGWAWKAPLLMSLPFGAIQAGLSIWVFPGLERLDLLTHKVPKPEMELS